MKIGTKSILFGAHCFFLHPFFVFAGWWKLYGFSWDPRLWVAFFVHDLGYLGKPNMDGPEGESHPLLGAKIMALFDRGYSSYWHDLTLLHSRFWARRVGRDPSRLCAADKLATCLTPRWLYLPMIILSGEAKEYYAHHLAAYDGSGGKYTADVSTPERGPAKNLTEWHGRMVKHMAAWAKSNA